MTHTLVFNNKQQWRAAMALAVEVVDSIQSIAHFPSVSITPNWSNGRVEIRIPIGTPLHHERLAQLQEACNFHDCEYLIRTHRPGGEFFQEPYVNVYCKGDDR